MALQPRGWTSSGTRRDPRGANPRSLRAPAGTVQRAGETGTSRQTLPRLRGPQGVFGSLCTHLCAVGPACMHKSGASPYPRNPLRVPSSPPRPREGGNPPSSSLHSLEGGNPKLGNLYGCRRGRRAGLARAEYGGLLREKWAGTQKEGGGFCRVLDGVAQALETGRLEGHQPSIITCARCARSKSHPRTALPQTPVTRPYPCFEPL